MRGIARGEKLSTTTSETAASLQNSSTASGVRKFNASERLLRYVPSQATGVLASVLPPTVGGRLAVRMVTTSAP